ncbi:MAG: hypothetical protein ABUL62_13385 [Myxococcales bacterium]
MTPFFAKLVAFAAFLMLFGAAPAALAQAPRVLLIRPSGAAREVKLALVRVEGELTADGFEVVPIEAEPGASSASSMALAESGSGATTVGLFLNADGTNAELWVVDKLTDKTVVRRLATSEQSDNALPEVLAVRVVELLRASLLELVVERKRRAAPPTADGAQRASEWAARPLAGPPSKYAVEAGLATIWSPTQVDPAFESVARGRFALTQRWHVRVSFIGLGTRPEVSGVSGSAAITQSAGLVELLFSPLAETALHPVASFGVGSFHTTVNGTASWPYRGRRDDQWAVAADVGVGLAWRFASRLELSVEGHGLMAMPQSIVRFATTDGPHVAHPALIGALSFTGWL